jgi:AAA+ superfamily predicted ATPase
MQAVADKSAQAKLPYFKPGDKLVVLRGSHDNHQCLLKPEDSEYYIAEVLPVMYGPIAFAVEWSGYSTWVLNPSGKAIHLAEFESLLKKYSNKKTNKPVDIKVEELDKLVIDDQNRKEIIQVLKQYKHMDKIFNEWGLGTIMEYGKAMSLLFYGPPGTGKTWGANCIAKALGKELMIISAAEIQTSEPGGANRNIQEAFEQAKQGDHVLFLDECDGLITDRTHVGMILASEINTLLTCLEKFEGIVIFATNRADTLDAAMARRISLIVEFKNPDEKTREQIWEIMLPPQMPLAKDVSVKTLAKFDITGGYIKNAILNAARAAVAEDCDKVSKRHFGEAIKRILETKDILGTNSSRKADLVKARG